MIELSCYDREQYLNQEEIENMYHVSIDFIET